MNDSIEKLRKIGESLVDPDLAVQMVESFPDAVVMVDVEGRIKYVNKRMELMFGYHRSELYDHLIDQFVPESQRDLHRSHRAAFENDPRPREMGLGRVLQGLHKSGRAFEVEISLSPIVAVQGAYTIATIRKPRDAAGA